MHLQNHLEFKNKCYSKPERVSELWALVKIQNLRQTLHETSSMLITDVLDSTLQIVNTFMNLLNATLFLVLLHLLVEDFVYGLCA